MVDVGTGLTILGSAYGGGKLIEKVLGPSADYIGDQLKEWTEKKLTNLGKVFKNAEKVLGDKINEPGVVPPKVVKEILDAGAWCEEDLQVQYLGGVLASSRSEISRDDRGAYFASLINRLTTYQLRAHYLFYQVFKRHFNGPRRSIGHMAVREKMEIFLPFNTFTVGMDFNNEERENFTGLLTHSLWGLRKEDLIEQFAYGTKNSLVPVFPAVPCDGITVRPTVVGTELFMWSHGYGKKDVNDFVDNVVGLTFELNPQVQILLSIPTKDQSVYTTRA